MEKSFAKRPKFVSGHTSRSRFVATELRMVFFFFPDRIAICPLTGRAEYISFFPKQPCRVIRNGSIASNGTFDRHGKIVSNLS